MRAAAEIDGSIVEEGMRRGVFALRDAREAASTMRAIFDGLMLQWLTEKDPDSTLRTVPPALRAGAARISDRRRRGRQGEAAMSDMRTEDRRESGGKKACANEGCGRSAEETYCDACALEWSLFHREERRRGPRPDGRPGRANLPGGLTSDRGRAG